jgi:predicted GNAT family N-acyltransferase
LEVRRISPSDTLPLRQIILHPNLPIDSCQYPGDQDDQTFHLGAFEKGKLVSIASFYFERHPQFDDPYQFRLRGMATSLKFQNKGLSQALLNRGFPIVKQNQCTLVWCFARKNAVGFYQKVGFEICGDYFENKDEGQQILMLKSLIDDSTSKSERSS